MTYYSTIILQIPFLLNILYILTSQASEFTNETLLSNSSIQPVVVYGTKRPLVCPPCEQIHCHKSLDSNFQCKGLYTVGICGCCKVCAKVEGESCGGEHNHLGRCDVNLECEAQPPRTVWFMKDGVKQVYTYNSGICKTALKKELPAKTLSIKCKPMCSAKFCNKNPRAVCSARKNTEFPQVCQGDCQHTTCRACRFIAKEETCQKCRANDIKCIKEFGRCFRRNICKPRQYPCASLKAVKTEESEFICAVPSCLD